MTRRVLSFLILLATIALCGGCASIIRHEDSPNGSEMPWNTPASWEGQGIGIPM